MDFKNVGWQDIVLKVPSDWEMVFATKEPKKKGKKLTGYFGFRTSASKMMELRWIEFDAGKKPELNIVVNDYFKSMKKKHKKIKKRTEQEIKIREHDAKTLYWTTEDKKIHGYIVVWACEVLSRIIILQSQFSSDKAKDIKSSIMQILETINCHPNDFESIWVAPNLAINTPRFLKLVEQLFLVGLSFFRIRHHLFEIFCYRLGLANQKIDSFDDLPEWFTEYYQKKIPGIPSGFKPKVNEFNKLSAKKEQKALWKFSRQNQKSKMKLIGKSEFQAFFWQNVEKNDIYCLIFKYKQRSKDIEERKSIIDKIVKFAITNN
jgi:hypothetical protein